MSHTTLEAPDQSSPDITVLEELTEIENNFSENAETEGDSEIQVKNERKAREWFDRIRRQREEGQSILAKQKQHRTCVLFDNFEIRNAKLASIFLQVFPRTNEQLEVWGRVQQRYFSKSEIDTINQDLGEHVENFKRVVDEAAMRVRVVVEKARENDDMFLEPTILKPSFRMEIQALSPTSAQILKSFAAADRLYKELDALIWNTTGVSGDDSLAKKDIEKIIREVGSSIFEISKASIRIARAIRQKAEQRKQMDAKSVAA